MKQKDARRIAKCMSKLGCKAELQKNKEEGYDVFLRIENIYTFNKIIQILNGEGIYVTDADMVDNSDTTIIAEVQYDGTIAHNDVLTIRIGYPQMYYYDEEEIDEAICGLEYTVERSI